jgi:hypothetical protein
MERLAAPQRKWEWILGIAVAVLVVLAVLFYLPRFTAAYELYWGQENLRRLFYEDLGLSEAWSSFIAVVGSFFYALAWVPLSLWTYRVLAWRFDNRQLAVAFGCWVLVYGHVPLMHALLGSDACFNQRTGAPLKWYVEESDGHVVLFDSAGFDSVTGAEKRPVTPEICGTFATQKANNRPRKITTNVRNLEFFYPTTGRARVWYSKSADGSYELFDARGFNPATSEPLLPVTKEIVADILDRASKEAEARREAEDAEATKRADDAKIRTFVPSFDLTGDWSGTATSGPAAFPYEWKLKQVGNRIDGTVRISSNGGTYFALFNIEGNIAASGIAFQGTRFINRVQGPTTSWCMPTGVLKYYDNLDPAKLEGTWGPNSINGGCPNGSGGSITLTRNGTFVKPPPPMTASISGVWNGMYFYPDGRQSVAFTFAFDSQGCRGRSEEPNTFGNPNAPKLFANLQCQTSSLSAGQTIAITKTYDGTGGVSHSVFYTGTVSPDLNQISGQWAINTTKGNFTMQR